MQQLAAHLEQRQSTSELQRAMSSLIAPYVGGLLGKYQWRVRESNCGTLVDCPNSIRDERGTHACRLPERQPRRLGVAAVRHLLLGTRQGV
jgi:hypothetical protein